MFFRERNHSVRRAASVKNPMETLARSQSAYTMQRDIKRIFFAFKISRISAGCIMMVEHGNFVSQPGQAGTARKTSYACPDNQYII
jgi:hypothetical protein